MIQVETFSSKMHYDKSSCYEELAAFLNELGEDVEVLDIEKEWKEDKNKASYSPSIYLETLVLVKRKIE